MPKTIQAMLFADIIGQQATKDHLINTVKDNRISHAQLFLGQEGYGTLALALAYAQFVMCQNPGETDACGTCPACNKVQKLQHPDLHFAFPTVGSKSATPRISDDYLPEWRNFITQSAYGTYEQWLNAMNAENAQGLIKVREAEQIVRKLSLKSFEAEYKIMIIWFPEKMNADAANKLLKLIEEPPTKTLFLLVAQNDQLIISTIISRTQLVKVPRIREKDLYEGLKNHFHLNEEKASHTSRMAEGDINKAKNFIEQSADAKQSFDTFTQMMRLSYMGKIIELVKWVDDVSRIGREKQKTLLIYSLKMVRENLILNQKQNKIARLTSDEDAFASKFSNFIHPENAPFIMQEFDLAYVHISRNANAKVVFLDLCIRLNRFLKMTN